MNGTQRRIQKEILEMPRIIPKNCSVWPTDENNLYNLTASIAGPDNSPYKEGIFFLSIQLAANYLFREPRVSFMTKIYHPYVCDSGELCLDILHDQWCPTRRISSVILSIIDLMSNVNHNDPLDNEIDWWNKNDKEEFEIKAREWTNMYAA